MRVTDTASFISKSKIVHGDRYDYSKSFYTKQKDKLEIICHQHGIFKQTPDRHIHGAGCAECAGNIKKDNSYFINKSIGIHGLKYNYSKSKYINGNEDVEIICNEHGSFWQSPSNHYAGKGCSKCAGVTSSLRTRKTLSEFLDDANRVHGDRYDYIKDTYRTAKDKMDIICRKHGVFKQSPNKHLAGQGCRKCFYGNSNHLWSYSAYKRKCEEVSNGKSKVYLIKCHGNGESFYKIGISIHGALSRFDRISKMPYLFELISEIEMDAVLAMKKESSIHEILYKKQYKPSLFFHGYTECFSELTDEVKDFFGVAA